MKKKVSIVCMGWHCLGPGLLAGPGRRRATSAGRKFSADGREIFIAARLSFIDTLRGTRLFISFIVDHLMSKIVLMAERREGIGMERLGSGGMARQEGGGARRKGRTGVAGVKIGGRKERGNGEGER